MHNPQPDSQNPKPETQTQSSLHMGRSLAHILTVLAALLLLVNLSIDFKATGLAHLLPESPAVALHEGMLLKGGGPEIYLLEEHHLRRIDSPEVLQKYFQANPVHLVEDSLLAQLGQGRPIHYLLQCQGSPDIYALENGHKRRVTESPIAEPVKPWDRVHLVSCAYLARLLDAPPVTADSEIQPKPSNTTKALNR